MAESHKKQLIEMERKAFELKDSSSEVSEKVVESNSTGTSQPISKVATDRAKNWVDSVSHKHLLTLLVRQVCWPSLLYQFRQKRRLSHTSFMQQTQVNVITITMSIPALSDPGIHSYGHRAIPQFGSASLLTLQASVPSVSFPVNNMNSSAHVLPPPSAVPLRTMSSNKTGNRNHSCNQFVQPESLPVPMLPAQPGSGFCHLHLLVVASHLLE